jgi:hypothetical protein
MVGIVGIPVVGSGGRMADRRRKPIAGLVALIAFSLVVCPLGWGAASAPARAAAQGTPWDIPTIVGTPIEMPTPISTVGPGQFFEHDDPLRPEVTVVAGDPRSGYGWLAGDPHLYAVWVTDESGTWYLIVEEGSNLITGEGEQHGFAWFIGQREQILADIAEAHDDMTTYNDTADGFFLGALGLTFGGAVCLAFTVGLCGVFLGGAIGAAWYMETNQRDAELEQNNIEALRSELRAVEEQMGALFERHRALAPLD